MEYKKNLFPGIVLTICSVIFIILTSRVKKFTGLGADPLGARAVPYLWGFCLLILSLLLVARGLRQRKAAMQNNTLEKTDFNLSHMVVENREIIFTFVSLAVYIALLEPVGFLIMTALYLIVQTILLTPKQKRRYVIIVISSIVIAAVLDYVFVRLLNVLLPIGIFSL